MYLGKICIKNYLNNKNGIVTGQVATDGKTRYYRNEYNIEDIDNGYISISQVNGNGDVLVIPPEIELDEAMVAFFGLYSGDGSKGTEDSNNPYMIKPLISFSQKEPNLVKFAVSQFKKLFDSNISFQFSLGEDSAFFMSGDGEKLLEARHNGKLPIVPDLNIIRPKLNDKDKQYLKEKRPVNGTNEQYLAFYYLFKKDMEEILCNQKKKELLDSGVVLNNNDKVRAYLRRPFKKGARQPGGSSRSDEIYLRGFNGFGELFLKILHEMEQSIYEDKKISSFGLIEWNDKPSKLGKVIDIKDFFMNNTYGIINNCRPKFEYSGIKMYGYWQKGGRKIELKRQLLIDPLFCYVSGLYLAEGSTPKANMFSMFKNKAVKFNFGFTSTENKSIELLLCALKKMFNPADCLSTWKIKVGSQYFPELVVIGMKNGVPMLRGGNSGDGKMRTMEISLAVKQWALDVVPCLEEYADKYSHVEPTGAGMARIDFNASSTLCRWFFPVLMYAVFGELYKKPVWR